MLTTSNAAYRPSTLRHLLSRTTDLIRWPFTNHFASPIWLALRFYLAYMWIQFGVQKIGAGFLTGDPIGDMLQLVGNGTLSVPFEFYRPVARMLVDSGMTTLLSFTMPFLEMAVALSFATGVLVVPAAVGATLLNINFILSGIGQVSFDGRFIALQLLLILAFRIVGKIGIERLVVRTMKLMLDKVRARSLPA
jgi:uncharacterized membrane protein YphA (DoxX/SURF4 family)